MEKKPLVSIVITTYNRSHFLHETLKSINGQSYSSIEILVIDDGSEIVHANKNKEICQKFKKCNYYYKVNTGQPDSRNYGIKKVRGSIIGFCDDDDIWVKNKIEKQLKILKVHPQKIVTSCIGFIDVNGNVIGDQKCHTGFNHGYVWKNFLKKNRSSSITPLFSIEIFKKTGFFNPNFKMAEDWEFWRRASYYYEFYSIEENLAYVRIHENSMTTMSQSNVYTRFFLYRKLTKSLTRWGKNKFTKEEVHLIHKIEYEIYYKLMYNNYGGVLNKLKFGIKVFKNNTNDFWHLVFLFVKFNFKKIKFEN